MSVIEKLKNYWKSQREFNRQYHEFQKTNVAGGILEFQWFIFISAIIWLIWSGYEFFLMFNGEIVAIPMLWYAIAFILIVAVLTVELLNRITNKLGLTEERIHLLTKVEKFKVAEEPVKK